MNTNEQYLTELQRGERFAFGANWKRFLSTLNESRIEEAKNSLQLMLGVDDLVGKTFLDIGCGSGLFSLGAKLLGSDVYSFDYDSQSVACARELKRRFFPNDETWKIESGSVLDSAYLKSIGCFDIVYSWGVLHHTGNLKDALANAKIPVKSGGILCVAIYNDQGIASDIWKRVKKTYCSGLFGKYIVTGIFVPLFTLQSIAIGIVKDRNPISHFINYKSKRGMAIYYDWIDWLGGYPFEVAKPEEVFHFCQDAGFRLIKLKTTNRLGCNEFVFQQIAKDTL